MTTRSHNRSPKQLTSVAKSVTLQDVAQVAGVTSMTVSRVIKGSEGVGEQTRERVLRIVEELGYTPNLAARALVTGKTGVIAVVCGALNQPYYGNLVHLLETQITSSGYRMRLLHRPSDLSDLIHATNAAAVDGVIIAGRYHLADKFRALAPQAFRACVFIDVAKHNETDYVHCDLQPAVEAALELMLQSGRTRLAFVGHFQNSSHSLANRPLRAVAEVGGGIEERLRAYLSFMKKAQLPCELLIERPNSALTPASALTPDSLCKYLQEAGCPEGLVCVNDETAMYAYRALRDAGYRVPDDVMLVGCDGLPFMECFDPPLSTIAQPLTKICALAWDFLQARIADPALPPQQFSCDAELIVRQSLQP